MGYLDEDNYLYHAGRLGRFLKIAGEMVSLVQVEEALQKALPAGVEGAVVEVPDPVRGSRIVAAITGQADERALVRQIGAELPRIALPRQFVIIPELPHMPSGKIDYRALTDMVQDVVQAK
jgi:acyl-[acyl-carrier-protein]-phospholipid O-acyltransferase/long-chain-fatty-acid--[acyl-carrier-protein] ligase